MRRNPTKHDILIWISDNPTKSSKRDIARAFGVKGADRTGLRQILKELESEGHLEKRRKTHHDPGKLPPVAVLEILQADSDGDLFARPMEWRGEAVEPRIHVILRASDAVLGEGDRILARLTEVQGDDHTYEARLIRRISTSPKGILGVFRLGPDGGWIVPIERGAEKEWRVDRGESKGARDGELVQAEQSGPKARMGRSSARIISRLGDPLAPKALSLIAIHQHGIPDAFADDAIAEADRAQPAKLSAREDLTELPLVTIDPADAHDHDDAVWAHSDDDPKNAGGHVVWVAIADVARYVRPGSALDRDARKRGNSTYFPDRVVPMLPDRLSGDLCSLHEGMPRPCLAVRMVLDASGQKLSHRFTRGLMKSAASLNYVEVQAARDGDPNDKTAPLIENVINPLFKAYEAAKKARASRQPLDLDLPERHIVLSDDGTVTSVAIRDRLDAHRMVEEFMILANVAAAEELIARRRPLLFRIHEEPTPEKLDVLRDVAQASGFTLAKGQVLHTRHLNSLLGQAKDTEFAELINLTTLRSMTQAYYSGQNFGHFGLALKSYAHFTSPIRRYADLVVHRALILAHGWGDDGLSADDIDQLGTTATHISGTERRSMAAERDTKDRYLASYLADRVGGDFPGRVSGIARFGVFVKLDETGADGLIPVRTLGREYFNFDAGSQVLVGAETGLRISLGQRVVVRLSETVPVTGGLLLELLTIDDKSLPRARTTGRAKPAARKAAAARRKAQKIKRKMSRKRG